MCADHHEKITLPRTSLETVPGEITLTEFVVMKEDTEYSEKFELYHRKDKLKELIEEYIRKKGESSFQSKTKEATFWIKLEKCESIIDNLDNAFEVFQDMYDRFVGFREGVEEQETNANIILDAEVHDYLLFRL